MYFGFSCVVDDEKDDGHEVLDRLVPAVNQGDENQPEARVHITLLGRFGAERSRGKFHTTTLWSGS